MPNNHTFTTKNVAKSFILGVKIFSIRQLFFSLLILSSLLTLNFIRYSFFETPKTIAESSTPTGADNPTLSLTISGSNQINYSDSSITEKSATTNIKVKTDNETGYIVNFSNQAADTTLYNSDTSSTSKITSIISDTTTLPSNTYGWSLDNTTFQPIPAITQPKDIIKTEEPTDTTGETHELHIKTKINNTLDAGTYSTNLTFSVITNNAPTRAEFMANFSAALKQYRVANNVLILPTSFKRSQSTPNISTPFFTASSPTSISEIKVWIDQALKTCYWYTTADIANFNSDSAGFFGSNENFTELTDLSLKNLDAKNITLANDMFSSTKVTNLDLSKFKAKNLTNMKRMFANNQKLESLDLSKFGTSNVTDMSELFDGNESLTELNIENFDTQNVITMKAMFRKVAVESLRLSHFKTSKVNDMSYMFQGAKTSFMTVYNFDTSNVRNMTHMFENMPNLDYLVTACFDTSNVADMSYMYANLPTIQMLAYGPGELYDYNTGGFINKTQNATNLSHMFYNIPNLKHLETGFGIRVIQEPKRLLPTHCQDRLDRSQKSGQIAINTTKVIDMSYMFSSMPKLKYLQIDFNTFNTSNVINMSHMFSNLNNLICFSDYGGKCNDFSYENPNSYEEDQTKNRNFANMDTSNVTNMESMFENLESYNFIQELYYPEFQNYNLIGVENFRKGKIENLIKFEYNMRNVMNARRMFANTYQNQALDITGLERIGMAGHLDITEMFAMDEANRSELLTIFGVSDHCSGDAHTGWTAYTYKVNFNAPNITGTNVFKNTEKLFGAFPLPNDTIGNLSDTSKYSSYDINHFSSSNANDASFASPFDSTHTRIREIGYFSGIKDTSNNACD